MFIGGIILKFEWFSCCTTKKITHIPINLTWNRLWIELPDLAKLSCDGIKKKSFIFVRVPLHLSCSSRQFVSSLLRCEISILTAGSKTVRDKKHLNRLRIFLCFFATVTPPILQQIGETFWSLLRRIFDSRSLFNLC